LLCYDEIDNVTTSSEEFRRMQNNFIRFANEHDEQLIRAYFEQALKHYEEQGELLAMQDIKYFIQNMDAMRFYVTEESTLQITYIFDMLTGNGNETETGVLTIPFQNN